MDEKLLRLLKSEDSRNYLLVVQMYGKEELLEYILNIFISKEYMCKPIKIAWFTFSYDTVRTDDDYGW